MQSELAKAADANGIDIEPAWANGAKVFAFVALAHFPSDFPPSALRPYHVIAAKGDVSRVKAVLDGLRCKERPLLKRGSWEDEQDADVMETHANVTFTIKHTFVHVVETPLVTPRSKYAESSNDKRPGHVNPRAQVWRGCDWPSAQSKGRPSFSVHDDVIDLFSCHEKHDIFGALQCYSNMIRDGIEPDVKAFTIIIDIAGKCGLTDSCNDVERWMQERRIVPNEITFNCLIDAHARARNLGRAREYFKQMEALGIGPSLVTYNCLIKVSVAAGFVNEAMQWLEKSRHVRTANDFSFAPLMNCIARKGLVDKAEVLYEQKVAAGLDLDWTDFDMMARVYAKARDVEGVRKWVDLMKKSGYQPKAHEYTLLLDACCASEARGVAPKPEIARGIFLAQLQARIEPDYLSLRALSRAIGQEEALILCGESGISWEEPERLWKTNMFHVRHGAFRLSQGDGP
jgi:pentatricopeptide repeat protein